MKAKFGILFVLILVLGSGCPKKKKAYYNALDKAHVADHEEQIKKEEAEQKISSKKVLNKNNTVNKTRKSSNNIFDVNKGSSRN